MSGHGRPYNFFQRGAWARGHGERRARAYNGGLGRSTHWGPGAEPLVRGSGAKPPEVESLEAFAHLNNDQKFALSMPTYNEVWGRSTQRGPGADPLLTGQWRSSPLKLKAFKHLHIYKEGPKFAVNRPMSSPSKMALAVSKPT